MYRRPTEFTDFRLFWVVVGAIGATVLILIGVGITVAVASYVNFP